MSKLKRRAYIVRSTETANNDDLPGVLVDKRRVVEFLISSQGGAWRTDEISVCDDIGLFPTDEPVFDYALLWFSGHGFIHSKTGDTYIIMRDGRTLSVDKMNIASPRQTIVIDACRIVYLPTIEEMYKGASLGALLDEDDDYRMRCRATYDAAILSAEKGRIIVYSCSPDESAGENARIGGFFTNAILESASEFKLRAGGLTQPTSDSLSIRDAVQLAKSRLDKRLQNPRIEGGRRLFYFPFAVFP